MTEPHHGRALVLSFALERMERLARVRRRDVFRDVNFTGLAIDVDFDGADADFPEKRIRRIRRHTAVCVTSSDQLAALHGKVMVNQLPVRDFLSPRHRFAILQSDRFLRRFEMLRGKFENLLPRVRAR